jgi:hypothetical protein
MTDQQSASSSSYPEPREPYAWEIEQEEQAEYEAYYRDVLKDTY